MRKLTISLVALLALGAAQAQDMGKLMATGGVIQVEGAGGGGLTPWALISGYGTRDSWGANAHWTSVATQDYALDTYGVTAGFADRFEVSLARQQFRGSLAPLDQLKLQQDVLGVKLRVAGDAVYAQDDPMPQIAVGAMFKRDASVGGLGALGVTHVQQLGAKDDSGTDLYVSATKIVLEHSLLWNATLRATKANQFGLLGFGGDKQSGTRFKLEGSLAYLLHRQWVAGMEWRGKPHNLGLDPEKNAWDAFVAFFPSKHVSVTAAYVNLGTITAFNPKTQTGWYLSLQAGY